jgi:hypothetical protein
LDVRASCFWLADDIFPSFIILAIFIINLLLFSLLICFLILMLPSILLRWWMDL